MRVEAVRAFVLLGLLAALSQPDPLPAQTDSVTATPKMRYPAGPLHRLLLGSHNRSLWALPVKAPVLNLDRFAGGLTLQGLGGGQQTRSLRFRGADGREYAFRLVDKDASRTLDPELQRSIAADVLQDQVSALLPMAPLVVAPLLEAAGVLQASPVLFVMADDTRLGEHRAEFAGALGFMEERPNERADGEPGFAGAAEVIGSDEFLSRLERDPQNQVDERAFLRARLMDAYVGDWDRHPDQWRWGSFPDSPNVRWVPIARDRDWAIARLDGLLVWVAGFAFPHYHGFGYDYPSAFRMTWAGRALDRRLLTQTPRSVWEDEARTLTAALTDAVIQRAVRRLPTAYYERIGANLERAFRNRRDRLNDFALQFYELLAGSVDVHVTDRPELATIERLPGDSVRVTVTERTSGARAAPHFARTFFGNETEEIRLWLHGGEDKAEVSGVASGSIRIRLLGGGSNDTLIDRTAGKRVHFYDDRGDNTYELADDTGLDESVYVAPAEHFDETQQAPPRDWGSWWIPYPVLRFQPDVGLVAGAGFIRYGYGFRNHPWRTRLGLSFGFGTGSRRPQVGLDYRVRSGNLVTGIKAQYSGLDRDNFFGFGNETEKTEGLAFYRAEREDLNAAVAARITTGVVNIEIGPSYRAIRPIDSPGSLLDTLPIYGNGSFQEAGLNAMLEVDTRNSWPASSRGVHIKVDGRYFPSLLDVEESFGGVRGEGSVRFGGTTPASVVLALRTGGEKLWGRVPFHEAAYIGGLGTVRGFDNRRFAGKASAFANAELRLGLTDFYVLLPGRFGIFGLADTGRVFVPGDESSLWHSAAGGGIWISVLSAVNAVSIAVARSEERTGVYFQAGFMF